jgi:hypothetical protein
LVPFTSKYHHWKIPRPPGGFISGTIFCPFEELCVFHSHAHSRVVARSPDRATDLPRVVARSPDRATDLTEGLPKARPRPQKLQSHFETCLLMNHMFFVPTLIAWGCRTDIARSHAQSGTRTDFRTIPNHQSFLRKLDLRMELSPCCVAGGHKRLQRRHPKSAQTQKPAPDS